MYYRNYIYIDHGGMNISNIMSMFDQKAKLEISLSLWEEEGRNYNHCHFIDRIIWKPIPVCAILQKCKT